MMMGQLELLNKLNWLLSNGIKLLRVDTKAILVMLPNTGDSKTKDEKIISIFTPRWEGDIKIVDSSHFEMKAKGTDRWTFALHIAQADDYILDALKAKGVLKDNGRFFKE
jgi:hypothetical protein